MKTTLVSLSCHLGQHHPLFLHNVFVVLVNDNVGSRDAPEENFQKFDLKHFLNKIKKNESKFGVHPKISFIVVVFTVGAICFSCIRSGIFSDRSDPASCRTGKCCNLKSSSIAKTFSMRGAKEKHQKIWDSFGEKETRLQT